MIAGLVFNRTSSLAFKFARDTVTSHLDYGAQNEGSTSLLINN